MNGLIFGGGNIGRGFLGLLLSQAGFRVTFVEADAAKINALNAERAYPVRIVSSDGCDEAVVTSVGAVLASDAENVERAIVEADVILTAVGKNALRFIAPALARGLLRRLRERPCDHLHVAVVACENVQDNTTFLRDLVLQHVDPDERRVLLSAFSFPDCVVDRIVPNTVPVPGDSTLAVTVEDYFQLAIDRNGLAGNFPAIPGIDLTGDLRATLEQKLCTLNMAHAIAGYFGFLRDIEYVHEAVADSHIAVLLDGALDEVSSMLAARHASITPESQAAYASKIKRRFGNPHLRDAVVRVAREPMRKLGSEDRLVKPAILCSKLGTPPAFLASGITAALHFDYREDAEARSLVAAIKQDGIDRVLEEVSGLPRASTVARMVKADYHLRAL